MRARRSLAVGFVSVLVVFGSMSATAWAGASITRGANGALHGCISRAGVLKVVAFRAKCPHGQSSITFGANGRAGAVGAAGTSGSAGASGPAGPTGPAGAAGPAGATGPAGDDNAAEVTALQHDVATLQGQVTTLTSELNTLTSTFSGVSRSANTLVFSGMNLQLKSGAGSTAAAPNGLGNLIIGYNENPGAQTGSHNLVLGNRQSFTSYGGIVAGQGNTLSGPFASILAGTLNQVTAPLGAVIGGCGNLAGAGSTSNGSCPASGAQAVLGGHYNQASGAGAAVLGGFDDVASASQASVSGGFQNIAGGSYASVLGGEDNSASGSAASVAGGFSSSATGDEATLLSGFDRTAATSAGGVAGPTAFTS
jgi:hypothetical protein